MTYTVGTGTGVMEQLPVTVVPDRKGIAKAIKFRLATQLRYVQAPWLATTIPRSGAMAEIGGHAVELLAPPRVTNSNSAWAGYAGQKLLYS